VAQILNTKYAKFTYFFVFWKIPYPALRTEHKWGGGGREESALEYLVIKKKRIGERMKDIRQK